MGYVHRLSANTASADEQKTELRNDDRIKCHSVSMTGENDNNPGIQLRMGLPAAPVQLPWVGGTPSPNPTSLQHHPFGKPFSPLLTVLAADHGPSHRTQLHVFLQSRAT
jgi:hypothetical protein